MGNFRPLLRVHFEKFLKYKGFRQSRTKGSHYIWTKKGCRPLPVEGSEKEIPAYHLKTSCIKIG